MGLKKAVDNKVVNKVNRETRPNKVSMAVYLLYSISIIGIVLIFLQTSSLSEFFTPMSFVASFFVGDFFSFVILFFLAYMIGKGKNWARTVFFILFLIGIIPSILALSYWFIGLTTAILDPTSDPVSILMIFTTIFVVIKILFQVIACLLLFQDSSSDWFRLNL